MSMEPIGTARNTLGTLPRGAQVAVAVTPDVVALVSGDAAPEVVPLDDAATVLAVLERDVRPRWTWWSARSTADPLWSAGVRGLSTCWDLAAVHRLLAGGGDDEPDAVWAQTRGLDPARAPLVGQLDLLSIGVADGFDGEAEGGDPEDPVRADGFLRPEWARGAWASSKERALRWARLALEVASVQRAQLEALSVGGSAQDTGYAESAAELIAVELGVVGLPVSRAVAERVIAEHAGRRPRDRAEASAVARERDHRVHRLLDDGFGEPDLRSPLQVKEMLRRLGVDVPDTRSWRLEPYAATSPVVAALLEWRTAERYATTYGYDWLDAHLGADGRLRGRWGGSDGGAGRMTAQAGLHNMPAPLRRAVRAEPGRVFVRADLGQVEPRVLAAVSGDRALAVAAQADDLYLPVAERLGCERRVAKVAVLAAMYGQTSGAAGEALAQMKTAYPAAMRFLRAADHAGRESRGIRTYGGRLVSLRPLEVALDGDARRSAVAARGRYLRNASVQGAAAELFKAWTATVRAHLQGRGELVMCLHDELVLHVRADAAADVYRLVADDLDATAARWFSRTPVRFVADVATLDSWADAKL